MLRCQLASIGLSINAAVTNAKFDVIGIIDASTTVAMVIDTSILTTHHSIDQCLLNE